MKDISWRQYGCPNLKLVPFDVMEALLHFKHFIILGHIKPDADCAVSQMAICLLLQHLGKNTQLVSTGPFLRPEIQRFAHSFDTKIDQNKISKYGKINTLVVILDCSTLERTGFAAELHGLTTMVIDHHVSNEVSDKLCYWDVAAPSTSMLVQNILYQLPLFLSQIKPQSYSHLLDKENIFIYEEIAHMLFLGFVTDTGFFRFLKPNNGGAMLRQIAHLVDKGINLEDVYQQVNGERLLGTRRILGLLLLRAGFIFAERLSISYVLYEDKKFWQTESNDSDSFYSLSLATQNCEVVILLDEDENACWNIGLRSVKQHDVSAIAKKFQGGGHKNSAGCRLENLSLDQLLKLLIQEVGQFWYLDSENCSGIIEEFIHAAPKFCVDQFI